MTEKIYTIPMQTVKGSPRTKRTKKAMSYLKAFLSRHLKSENIRIDPLLNEALWSRGMEHPPARIKVRATTQEDGSILVTPAGE